MNEEILTLPQAAKYCAISRWTLRNFVKSGDLKASHTPGGHWRILKSDLESFIYEKGMYPLVHNRSSSRKILIVDDDPLSQDLLTKMLSKDGYKTEIAADGFDAGFKIKDFKPGLIILDLIMPGMDGFELCTRVKENSETSHMKILAITGYDTKENRDRVMKAGADGYLAKPLAMDTLLQYVGRLLNRKGNMLKVER
ncbi:MAG TPA: response regulator [bacterium]|nr:response regulator [bacterium]